MTVVSMDLALKGFLKVINAVVWEHVICFVTGQIKLVLNGLFHFCSLSFSTAEGLQVSQILANFKHAD